MNEFQQNARRRSTPGRLLLLGLLCALLAACGGSSPSASRAAVRAVLRSFLHAVAKGDGRVACGHGTPAGQQKIVAALGPELQNFDIYGCDDVVYVTGAQMSRANRLRLETARITRVELDGSHATVPLASLTSPHGPISTELGKVGPIRLVESYGVWLITAL